MICPTVSCMATSRARTLLRRTFYSRWGREANEFGPSTLGYIIRLTFGGRANLDRRTFLSHSGRILLAAGLAPWMFAENRMSESNQRRPLSFSNDWIESVLVRAVREMPVEDAIVVNLSATAMHYRVGGDHGAILPWKSTILRHCTIESGERVALLHVRQRTNIGGVALGWDWYGRRNPQFPRGTPLYISSQDEIGDVQLDPVIAFGHGNADSASQLRYRLKLNLWY